MADKEDADHPHLENPNSPEYVCVECQNNEDSLCLECQEMAQLTPNSTRNGREGKDDALSDTSDSAYDGDTICDDSEMDTKKQSIPLDIDDESRSYVGHMIMHENPDSPVTTRSNTPQPTDAMSDTSHSAYSADTIIDSPRSTDTTFDLNDSDFVDENDLPGLPTYNRNESDIIQNYDESCFLFSPCYKPISNPSEESEDEM